MNHGNLKSKLQNEEQKKEVLRKSLLRATEYLHISRKELCTILGMSEASASRLAEGQRLIDPTSKEGELALLLIRLYRNLDTLFGGNSEQYQQWLRHENFHLQGIPIYLVQTIPGLVEVTSYLDAMRAKV